MLAVEGGHVNLVKLLLNHGINVHAKEKDDWTALMMAEVDVEEFNNFEIVNLLLKHGAKY